MANPVDYAISHARLTIAALAFLLIAGFVAYVTIPKESYPSVDGGRIVYADRQVDTAPFVCDSTYVEGAMTRLSTAELLNVTAGGGSQTPTFLAEPR